MKKYFLIVIFLSSLVAQANNPDSTNRKWELGVFYLPSTIDNFNDLFMRESNYLLGFSTHANIYMRDEISFETGINYKHKRIEKLGIIIYSGGANYNNFDLNDIRKTNFLEIPIQFKFYLQQKSLYI